MDITSIVYGGDKKDTDGLDRRGPDRRARICVRTLRPVPHYVCHRRLQQHIGTAYSDILATSPSVLLRLSQSRDFAVLSSTWSTFPRRLLLPPTSKLVPLFHALSNRMHHFATVWSFLCTHRLCNGFFRSRQSSRCSCTISSLHRSMLISRHVRMSLLRPFASAICDLARDVAWPLLSATSLALLSFIFAVVTTVHEH